MPNMSYCRAENTLEALQQILGDVEAEGFLETFRDSSLEEFAAAVDLVNACRSYIAMFEAMSANDLIAYMNLVRS